MPEQMEVIYNALFRKKCTNKFVSDTGRCSVMIQWDECDECDKCDECDECAGSRHFERSPPEAGEVRNPGPVIGTKYIGIVMIVSMFNG